MKTLANFAVTCCSFCPLAGTSCGQGMYCSATRLLQSPSSFLPHDCPLWHEDAVVVAGDGQLLSVTRSEDAEVDPNPFPRW